MGRDRVLIVGVSTRALAESASVAGYECLSVDAFGDLDQKERVQNVGLLRDRGCVYSVTAAVAVARGLSAGFAAYNGNLENHPAAVERLARGRVLLGNSPQTLVRARDFPALARVARKAGVRVPQTHAPGHARRGTGGKQWLRKPLRGGGGDGVREWTPGMPVRPHEVIQERIEGVLASMSFAADGKRAVVLGLARGLAGDDVLGAREFRYCGSLFPFEADGGLVSRLEDLAQAATRAFGLRGTNGIDFIVRDGEAYVLELNPRYSASMEVIERGRRLSVFEVHRAACDGALPPPPGPLPTRVFGKAILWARGDRVAGDTRPWLARDDVRDVPFPGDRFKAGQPICTVFAEGVDAGDCYQRLVATATRYDRELLGGEAEARA
jgi:hypothetical protein